MPKPKGLEMKSDTDLRYDIQAELLRQLSAGAEAIDVQALDGVVTLTGYVSSDPAKWRLDDAIRLLPGVRGLIDETMVKSGATLASPDPDTARPWFHAG